MLFGAWGCLLFGTGSARAQAITFSNVADTTTAVPGQSGNFTSFRFNPSISGTTVAYHAYYSGGEGVYTGTAFKVGASLIADHSTAVPGSSGTFTGVLDPTISGTTAAFAGGYNGGNGIYTGMAGSTGANLVANTSTTAPGQSTTFRFFGNPAVSGGTIGFGASYDSAGDGGVYTTAGGLSRVADSSTVAPGGNSTFNILSDPGISGSNLAVYGEFGQGQTHSGIYTGAAGAAGLNRVVDDSSAVPARSGRPVGSSCLSGQSPAPFTPSRRQRPSFPRRWVVLSSGRPLCRRGPNHALQRQRLAVRLLPVVSPCAASLCR